MAKLMAPNIRIDWYPEGHFADIHNPTIAELNSGVNLSCAVVTGYTLDFTDSNTEDTTTIFDTFTSEDILNHSYEADLEFFLAPRGSNADNEEAYRKAEELFYNPENRVGYLAKRFGFPWNEEYTWRQPRQHVDLFKVQADLPKVVSEDGAPILLNVKYIPQGEAVTGAKAGAITYEWEGEPHASTSVKKIDGEVVARNLVHDPGFEYGLDGLQINVAVDRVIRNAFERRVVSGQWSARTRGVDDNSATAYVWKDITDISGGAWIALAAQVMGENVQSARAALRVVFLGDGLTAQYVWASPVLDVRDQFHRLSGAVQIPEGYTSAQIMVYMYADEGNLGGGWTSHDDWMVAVADSEADALAQAAEYFDGDTADK